MMIEIGIHSPQTQHVYYSTNYEFPVTAGILITRPGHIHGYNNNIAQYQ